MTNYIEWNGKYAFHPGYYIEEIIEDSGLTQQEFAIRLNTTPKTLSQLIRGKQRLSTEMAGKLASMFGTSTNMWLNMQSNYDALLSEIGMEEELSKEREVFKNIDYSYFIKNFGLPELMRDVDERIKTVREFLNIASLSVLREEAMSVSFRSQRSKLSELNQIRANIMVQLALNKALTVEAPDFDREKLKKTIPFLEKQINHMEEFPHNIIDPLKEAGVILVILPNLTRSKTNGAVKKIGKHVMMMVNDRRLYTDTFWFTFFHEIGHIINNDFGVSFDGDIDEKEEKADAFAADILIPKDEYSKFLAKQDFSADAICRFAKSIDRTPAIIVGRLQIDGYVTYNNASLQKLKNKINIDHYLTEYKASGKMIQL